MSSTMSEEPVLSPRELEVLELVAKGATNQEIARELHISPNTVKVHLRNIYEKLGVSSRTEASMVGVRAGLIALPGIPNDEDASSSPEEIVPVPKEADTTPAPTTSETSSPVSVDATVTALPQQRERLWLPWVLGGSVVVLMLLLMIVIWRFAQPQQPLVVVSTEQTFQRWRTVQPLPAPLADMAATPTDRWLALVGGEGEDGVTNAFWVYDTRSDAWQAKTAFPFPLRYAQSAWLGGRLYVVGGETADGTVSDAVWVYTPDTNTWEPGVVLPAPRSRGALVAFEGALYLIGGGDGQQAQTGVWRYSPIDATWEEVATLAEPRFFPAATVTRQGIFVYGGETVSGEPTAKGWQAQVDGERLVFEPVQELPAPMARVVAASLAETLYFFDGKGIWQATPTTREWVYTPLPENSTQIGAAFLAADPYLYVMGGRDSAGRLSATVWRYTALFRTFAPVVPAGP
nr:helix-turn-helix domain-containing protein [Ardenticatena sp.]